MHRTDASGNAAGLFTDGDPGSGTPATVVDSAWLNDVQEDLCSLIENLGGTLVKGTQTQLLTALGMFSVPSGGRLTIQTGVGVPTSDQTAATTVYYTPFKSDRIMLYDGTRWVPHQFAEISQATSDATKSPAAVANNSNYDVFVWNDAGTMRATRGPLWTSDTARGSGAGTTELELFEGRYVNKNAITNGPAARRGRYVGSFRSDASAHANDSLAKRHVWNYENRVPRPMKAIDATNSWNYTTTSFRQANAAAANQLDYIVGLSEDLVEARVLATVETGAAGASVGVGIDSTTVNSADIFGGVANNAGFSTFELTLHAQYSGFPGIGRHFLAWLELGAGSTVWYGDNGGTTLQSGIVGRIQA